MTTMTIGRLAKAAGIPVDTIRYYEKIGLLAPPRRSAAGYRHYGADTLERLGFIGQAKTLGFTLGEIDDLLSINAADNSRCGALLRATEAKLAATRAMIADLARMKAALQRLARACPGGDHPLAHCPILQFLRAPLRRPARRPRHTRRRS
ncbi:MAG: heavy metal-responsive transcriptional regulator [Rhodospirillaceae bacterium]|nr:heavy metal-responsive transcriptional regulator [Rhodospirillaceae bacterium]